MFKGLYHGTQCYRELLWTLTDEELWLLEKALSNAQDNGGLTDESFQKQLDILHQKPATTNRVLRYDETVGSDDSDSVTSSVDPLRPGTDPGPAGATRGATSDKQGEYCSVITF